MGGFFGMQGPPAVLYFIQSELTKEQYMAKDKEGRDVFLADSGYVLSMAQEDFKHIKFHFTSEFW